MVNEQIRDICTLWYSDKLQYTPRIYDDTNWLDGITIGSKDYFLLPVFHNGKLCIVVLYCDVINILIYEDTINYRSSPDSFSHEYSRETTHEELFQLSTVHNGVIEYDSLIEAFKLYDSVIEVLKNDNA